MPRLAPIVAGATLVSLMLIGVAPAAHGVAQPVPDGMYLAGPGWAVPDEDIGLLFVGDPACTTPKQYQFVPTGGGSAVTLTPNGLGFPDYGTMRYVHIPPTTASGPGTVVFSCQAADASLISSSVALNVTSIQPASTYHTPSMLTLLPPDVSGMVAVNKVGYLPGESVTITIYDKSLGDAQGLAAAMAEPVTVVADGEGAITAQIAAPNFWDGTDVQGLFAAATSRLFYDTAFETGEAGGDPSLIAPSTVSAGDSIAVSGTGFAPSESVIVALHSASAPALILGTLVASGTGAISGNVTIPAVTIPGGYRLWAGSKTISYLLLNRTITVGLPETFADVPASSSFYTYIEWMSAQNISTGTTQPSGKPLYKPANAVSRQAMAQFMYRLSGETFTPTGQTFGDVDSTSQFYVAVEWMAYRGISVGTAQPSGPPLFKPSDAVSRQAMAVFLARYSHVNLSTPPTVASFADVPTSSSFAAAIGWMKDTAISTGTAQPSGLPLYKPADPVSRQAMAAFLYRLAHLPG